MLVAFKENFLRPQPRTSPSEATFRALERLPSPPKEIQKVDPVLVLGHYNNRALSWKPRFLDRRRRGGISNSNTTSSETSGSKDIISEIHPDHSLSDASNLNKTDSISQSVPAPDQSSNVAVASTPARSSSADNCPDLRVLQQQSKAIELEGDQKHELEANSVESGGIQVHEFISASNSLHSGDLASTTKEQVPSIIRTTDDSNSIQSSGVKLAPFQSMTDTDARESPLQHIGPHCYVAFDSPVSEQHQTEYDQKLRRRLTSFLESLKLKDKNILFGCFAASTSPNRQDLRATIIFFCLNPNQQKTIASALERRDKMNLEVVPSSRYSYAVVNQDIRLSSEIGIPLSPGPISGRGVWASIQNEPSLCGVLGKISASPKAPLCTIGGLIVVSGSVYALTTSHAFLGRGKSFGTAGDSDKFEPAGTLFSYKFTETASMFAGSGEMPSNLLYDQDWALIHINSPLQKANIFRVPGDSNGVSIKGAIPNTELNHGSVRVLSAINGICEGYLTPSFAYWMFERSVFEVRMVVLEKELSDGDSGSWVIRGERLCGYILSRAIGKSWGFMICIEPVIQDIGNTLSVTEGVSFEIPSLTRPNEIRHKEDRPESPAATKEAQEKQTSITTSEERTEYLTGWRLHLVSIALCLSVFMMALDDTTVATAVPKITDQLKSLPDVGWYGSAYLLTAASLHLKYCDFYTFFSVKWVFLTAIGIFELGSLICGVAPDSVTLIIGRAIAGIGSAGLLSGAAFIVAYSVPLDKRPMYNGFTGFAYGIASVAGPLVGGVFTDKVTWRWCFYINLPIGAVVVIFIFFFFTSSQQAALKDLSWKESVKKFDLYGTAVFMPAIICLLLALQWSGTKYAWDSGRIIALFVLFGVFIGAFIGIQFWKQDFATVPPKLFKNRTMVGAAWFAFCFGSFYFLLVYYLPIWFQAVKGASAIKSGIMNLSMILTLVVVRIIASMGVTLVGFYTPLMIVSSVFTAVGVGLMCTFEPDTNHSKWIGYQAIVGIGIGLGMNLPIIAVQNVLDITSMPTGISVIFFLQTLGGALSVSIGQNVFSNKLVQELKIHAPEIDPFIILNTGATLIQQDIDKIALSSVTLAYNNALIQTFLAAAIMAALTIIGAAAVEWKSVKQKNAEVGAA